MSRRSNRNDPYRNTSNRDGGRNTQFYGHDDRGRDDHGRDDRGRDDRGRDEGSWRGGHFGGSDNWRGKSKRGGRGGSSGRDGNRESGSTGGKWQRGKGPRRRGSDRGGHHGPGPGPGPGPRTRLMDDDGDVPMGDFNEGPSQRFNPYGRPNNKRGNRSKNRNSQDGPGSGLPLNTGDRGRGRGSSGPGRHGGKSNRSGGPRWCTVTIPHGRKQEKDWLIRSLQNACSVPFIPLEFHYEGESAVFTVDNLSTGDALRSISRQITSKTGHKIIVLTKPCRPLSLDDESLEALKLCLSERYDPSSKSLDLSRLTEDQGLRSKGVTGVLGMYPVMTGIIRIISENIPEVLSIDLSDNRLYNLSTFARLASKATTLRSLNLAKNMLRSESDLETMKEFKLEELVLQNNPVAEKSNYTSLVRRIFPKVIRLDGQDLPPPIAFDVDSLTVLPKVQHSFFGNADIKKLLVKFIEQYFMVFDSGNRQPFIEIYHDQACFSMTCQHGNNSNSSIRNFMTQSRNLLTIKDKGKEVKLFKYTKLSVVAHLNEMPATQHDNNSFQVDLSFAQGNLICFTVHGIYKDLSTNRSSSQLVSFSRTFLAIMQPPTLCIVNDHLMLRQPTHAQMKAAFASPAPTPSPSPVTVPQGSLSPAQGLTTQQQEMVAKFIKDSNMNADWSIKCLVENEWDYEKAGISFTSLHSHGKIPVDAFVK